MIFFHACFDLTAFGLLSIDFQKETFWYVLPRIIVTLFMFSVGASLYIVHGRGIKFQSFLKRQIILMVCALAISAFTYYAFPTQWIYFGTLHSIAVCSAIALAFIKIPRIASVIGILIVFPHLFKIYQYPFWQLSHRSMDYIPPLPWVGVALMGMGFATTSLSKRELPISKWTSFIQWCSRHSLKIYLVHQPLLWGLSWILWKIKAFV